MEIGDGMILEITEAPENQLLIFNYIIPDDEEWLSNNDSLKYLLPQTLYNFAYNNLFKVIRDNQISLIYRYRSNNGKLFYEQLISPEDYLNYKPSEKDLYDLRAGIEKSFQYQIPMDMPNGSTLFDMSFIPPDTLEYKNRIKDVDSRDGELTFNKSIALEDLYSQGLILLDYNTVFRYLYYDKNDVYLGMIEMTPDDYQDIIKEMKGETTTPNKADNQDEILEIMKTLKKELSTDLPQPLPSGAILIGFDIIEDPKTIIHTYKFPDVDIETDSIEIDKDFLISNMKTGEDMIILFEANLLFQHIIYDKNDSLIEKITITPADYQYLIKEMKENTSY